MRQINTAFLPIHSHVLPEVDELESGADAVALRQAERVGVAVEVQEQTADGVGAAAGIVHQLAEVLVAGFHYVLAEGGEQVVERLKRQLERPDGFVCQPPHQLGMRDFARADVLKLGTQAVKLAQAFFLGQIAFVGDVVGSAGEGVDGMHGAAQAARQGERADGKVFVVSD